MTGSPQENKIVLINYTQPFVLQFPTSFYQILPENFTVYSVTTSMAGRVLGLPVEDLTQSLRVGGYKEPVF